jgi:O-antigen/teichoic acid export membrane protein
MGLVVRQTIKNNFLAYIGVVIGVVSQLLVYAQDKEITGFLQTIIKYGQVLLPFLLLGMSQVIFRFLPYSANERDLAARQLFTRGLVVVTATTVGVLLLNLLVGDVAVQVLEEISDRSFAKLANYRVETILLGSIMAFAAVITTHLTNFHRVAIPVIFNSLFLKIGLPLTVLAYIAGMVTKTGALWAIITVLALATLGLALYATQLKVFGIRWGKLNLENTTPSEMYSVAGFSILASMGSTLAIQLDAIMVNGYLGDSPTAVYLFSAFAAMVIGIPYKAINSIASPLVATALEADDRQKVKELYQQASQVLYAVGAFVLTGIVVCLPYTYGFTEFTQEFSVGYTATILLGIGQLFDQATSINAVILGQSRFFRWNVLFVLLMAICNVIFNIWFLGLMGWGLTGAALATAISLCFYNVIKAVFLYYKVGVQPFTPALIYTTLAMSLIGTLAYFIPDWGSNAFLNFTLKGTLISVLFFLYVYYTNGVPPMKAVLRGGIGKLFK